ncbi:polyprenyl synthetase family protein [Subsaximicrobium wynnwilliamsii]|jgi:geranylgeranyl diphosphate synthase type II|uniref:Polyprenyl synthetase family protein n=1 Tax=Subsaximicrobium wynnwilliamsii TaxID=291179 RepID=A0A5C6ZBH6_9FLAO|nr:polyprenyl synthetase family protein [Subsaximicrobium wynnwilliamsii]TXD81889.1 polyprenyl synthetase family protein [Subsaximicrobium wynnwilliamsii]TXD86789.1 polyprenyl synthetase family protein [Subsaximicrobium wynnwilliamsii]TXE01340.1 polyprenyl synthetase family protein [Subsaximicrobium wynnwilliamsii]
MQTIESYHDAFVTYLSDFVEPKEPKALYEPIQYILQLGGKRLRPILTLMTTEILGGDYKKAMDAALSVEVFHNFSLVHDDIMDAAPLRRGQETVHTKWDVNTAILSGDAMLIMAYQLFENYEPKTFRDLAKLFSKTALEVCEGQQYDVDFETRDDVTIAEYLKMIEYKTAVLVGAAMQMGAIVANASEACQKAIYDFGKNLGIAFQLQDDYLDAFGDPETFGKQVGGDIIENKKTILYLKALEFSNVSDRRQLEHLYGINPSDPSDKIEAVKQLFVSSAAAEATSQEISRYTEKAFAVLEGIEISEQGKAALKTFGKGLMKRDV